MNAKSRKVFEIIGIVLLFAAMGLILFNIMNATSFMVVCFVVLFCALVSGALYYLYGCKKDAAKYFKVFIYLYALSTLLRIAALAGSSAVDNVLAAAVNFGAVCVFSMAMDLGRQKSTVLGIVALAANLYILIRALVTGAPAVTIFEGIANLILAAVLNLMIIAKYEDKLDRGSK